LDNALQQSIWQIDSFDNLKGKRNKKLTFDFAVLNNKNLLYLIEYDGAQHFVAIKIWGGTKRLKRQKVIDKLKTLYCKNNGINLIRLKNIRPEKITIDMLTL